MEVVGADISTIESVTLAGSKIISRKTDNRVRRVSLRSRHKLTYPLKLSGRTNTASETLTNSASFA